MLGTVRKRSDDQLDYDVDFSRWLSAGDSITSAVAIAAPLDVTNPSELTVNSVQVFGMVVKVWLAAGIAGNSYQIQVTATTAQGRVKDVTFNLRIVEC
jgi:hypothetical protein